jgi:TetR/AcrR family transcriptional repressor of nem operon
MARQKEFDPDTALARAVEVFWRKGYEATSMQDLVDEMGVHKRSMYDTYGDKRSLFLRAMARYADLEEEAAREMVRRADSPVKALRQLLESSIYVKSGQPPGCLMVNCATEVAPHDAEVASRVRAHFQFSERLLAEVIAAGQADGSIDASMDAVDAARHIFNAWLSVRIQVRTGIGRPALARVIDSALALVA